MTATVYEQNIWFRRFQSVIYGYMPISVVMILALEIIYILIEDQITDLGFTLILYSGFVTMFWVIAFVAVYHFILKRMLIANLSRLFRQISKNDNDLFVAVAEGRHSLFSRDQFVKEIDRMRQEGAIHPLTYKGYVDGVTVEWIKSIEVYDFRNAEHRACLEKYLKQLRSHIECLESEPAKIAQKIAVVRAEEEKYRGYLIGQPA